MKIDPIPQLPACVKHFSNKQKEKLEVAAAALALDKKNLPRDTATTDKVKLEPSDWNAEFKAAESAVASGTLQDSSWATMVEEGETETTFTELAEKPKRIRKRGKKLKYGVLGQEGGDEGMAEDEGTKPKAPRTKSTPKPMKSPEMAWAQTWAAAHIDTRENGDSTMAPLRAYALWEIKRHSVDEIAGFLGIQSATVAKYITDAVKRDGLE